MRGGTRLLRELWAAKTTDGEDIIPSTLTSALSTNAMVDLAYVGIGRNIKIIKSNNH